jgi:hypothetical protein
MKWNTLGGLLNSRDGIWALRLLTVFGKFFPQFKPFVRKGAVFEQITFPPEALPGVAFLPQLFHFRCVLISKSPEFLRMVHLVDMSKLMYHNHLDKLERKPSTCGRGPEHKLNHFARVEVSPYSKLVTV